MQPYTYLLVNLLTVIVCFIFSFHRQINFHKHFGSYLKACSLVAIPFIAWDIWFTRSGVWWFNTDYTVNVMLSALPLEEWLFFFCIPFSCVFTYYCLDKFFNLNPAGKWNGSIVWVVTSAGILAILLYSDRTYTLVTAVAAILTVLFLHYAIRASWIGKLTLTYIILLPGFFLVNGVLTGTGLESPVVNYNFVESRTTISSFQLLKSPARMCLRASVTSQR